MALDLQDDWFVNKTDKHVSALRSNNYPDQASMVVPEGSIRCSAHTDYGTLTILKSGAVPFKWWKDTMAYGKHGPRMTKRQIRETDMEKIEDI